MTIHFKAKSVVLEPTTAASVPNGALYLDTNNANALTVKSTSGVSSVIGAVPSASNIFIKQMVAGMALSALQPVAKRNDGKIVAADSDAPTGQIFIGWVMAPTLMDGDLVNVLTVGANIVGAIIGGGFTSGDEIYLSETGGYTSSDTFTGGDDALIRVGIADCAAGIASGTAEDLIAFAEVVSRP
jgi:hypothetical protein